ncbi:hypothetical protein VIGAN_11065100, partial [Vigna angularis var. angularis]
MSQSHEKTLILIQKMVKVPPPKALLLFNSSTYEGLHHTPHSISFILNHLLSHDDMLPQAQSLILRLISGRIPFYTFSPSSLIPQLTQAHFTSSSTYAPLCETIVNAYVHSH